MTSEERSERPPWLRWIAVFLLGVLGIASIGVFHRLFVYPQEKVWAPEGALWTIPMPITISTDIARYERALELAVEQVNQEIGCEIFRVSRDSMVAIVEGTIEVGAESEDWAAGASVNRSGTRGEVVVYRPLMVGTDLLVIKHEAGHLLGLAHEHFGLMRPVTKERIGGPIWSANFSDKDSRAIAGRYCQERASE